MLLEMPKSSERLEEAVQKIEGLLGEKYQTEQRGNVL